MSDLRPLIAPASRARRPSRRVARFDDARRDAAGLGDAPEAWTPGRPCGRRADPRLWTLTVEAFGAPLPGGRRSRPRTRCTPTDAFSNTVSWRMDGLQGARGYLWIGSWETIRVAV